MIYLVLFAGVFVVNLLPAFGPPTWALLLYLRVVHHVPVLPLVVLGGCAAGAGRLVLAQAASRLKPHLSSARQQRLETTRKYLEQRRSRSLASLGLFALSPVPSGQLFVAAGMLELPLVRLTLAFFCGRLVSYSLYVTAGDHAADRLGSLFVDGLTSPWAICTQVGVYVLLAVGLMRPMTFAPTRWRARWRALQVRSRRQP